MPLVQITWTDAVGGDGWVTYDDLLTETTITHVSVGFLVHETDDFYTITMSKDEKRQSLGAWLLIPKKYVDNFLTLSVWWKYHKQR